MLPHPAFQFAVAITTTRLRNHLPPRSLITPLSLRSRPISANRIHPKPSCIPISAATPPAASPPELLLDTTISLPSSLPSDRHHPVKISLTAESLGPRIRRVRGAVSIDTSPERVWHVLTSYSSIADYMPNVISSEVIYRRGELLLDQVGILSRKLGLRSRMVVSILEDEARREIMFSRVEGRDFVKFDAKWVVTEVESGVKLCYELLMKPFPLFPMALVDRKMYKEMPIMLAAIREEALAGRYIPIEKDSAPRDGPSS